MLCGSSAFCQFKLLVVVFHTGMIAHVGMDRLQSVCDKEALSQDCVHFIYIVSS